VPQEGLIKFILICSTILFLSVPEEIPANVFDTIQDWARFVSSSDAVWICLHNNTCKVRYGTSLKQNEK
jgi:hypothetical protein